MSGEHRPVIIDIPLSSASPLPLPQLVALMTQLASEFEAKFTAASKSEAI